MLSADTLTASGGGFGANVLHPGFPAEQANVRCIEPASAVRDAV